MRSLRRWWSDLLRAFGLHPPDDSGYLQAAAELGRAVERANAARSDKTPAEPAVEQQTTVPPGTTEPSEGEHMPALDNRGLALKLAIEHVHTEDTDTYLIDLDDNEINDASLRNVLNLAECFEAFLNGSSVNEIVGATAPGASASVAAPAPQQSNRDRVLALLDSKQRDYGVSGVERLREAVRDRMGADTSFRAAAQYVRDGGLDGIGLSRLVTRDFADSLAAL